MAGEQVAWTSMACARWRRARRRSEARGLNLDGGRTVEVHVEEERGVGVEAIGVALRQTGRSGRRRVCGGEMTWLGFRGSGTLKKKNSSDGYDDIINARRYM
jgi:hypothetical protein